MKLTTQLLKQLIREVAQGDPDNLDNLNDLEFLRVVAHEDPLESINNNNTFSRVNSIYKTGNDVAKDYIEGNETLNQMVGNPTPKTKERFKGGLNILKALLETKYSTSEGDYPLDAAARYDFDVWDAEHPGEPFERVHDDLFLQVARQIKDPPFGKDDEKTKYDHYFKQAAELLIGLRIVYTDPKNSRGLPLDPKKSFSYVSGPIESIGFAEDDENGYKPAFVIKTKKIEEEVDGKRKTLIYSKKYYFGHPRDLDDIGRDAVKSYKILISQAPKDSI